MDLETAEARLSSAVYAATALFEDLEHAGQIRGNGYQVRQQIAEWTVNEVRRRWTDRDEAIRRIDGERLTNMIDNHDFEQGNLGAWKAPEGFTPLAPVIICTTANPPSCRWWRFWQWLLLGRR